MGQKKPPVSGHITPADIQRVMDVAGRLFAEHGFDGVGIRQIAAQSGVTMPSIFYHFGSKALLYEEIVEYKYQVVEKTVSDAIRLLNDPREKVKCIIGSFFDLLSRDRSFQLLVHRDIIDVVAHKERPAFTHVYANVYAVFCQLLRSVLGREVGDSVSFPLVSLILGYCELTSVLSESESVADREAWYISKREALISSGMRICDL